MSATEFSQVMVRECPRCGSGHVVEAREFDRAAANEAYTHWFMCPVVGEPAYLHLRAQARVQLDQELLEQLAVATEAGAYLVTISRVQDGRLYRPFWQTHNFPRGDIEKVLEQLQGDLNKEKAGAMPPAKLATASPPPMFPQQQGQPAGPASGVISFDNQRPTDDQPPPQNN